METRLVLTLFALQVASGAGGRIEVPVPRWERYFRNLCNLYVIQVGANCGTNTCSGSGGRKDPVWSYQSRYNWSGAVIEANPATFDELRKNYRPYPEVEPINVAIDNSANGTMDFWCPGSTQRLSEGCTTNRAWAARGMGMTNQHLRQHMRVRAKSLAALWAWLGPSNVDILVVDVEGSEAAVLGEPLPWPRPAMIFFETSGFSINTKGDRLMAFVRGQLEQQGYAPVVLGDTAHDGWGPLIQDRNWKDDLWWLPGHPSLGLRKGGVRDSCPSRCSLETRYDTSHSEPPSVPVGCVCAEGAQVQCSR